MITAFVKKLNTKTGTGKRGKWTLYSFIGEKEDGSETGWISAGFDAPPFSEGDYITFETETTERGLNLKTGSVKQLAKPATSVPVPTTGGYNPGSRDASIQYQSSRKDALSLVSLLLEHDGLPMSSSAAKAGQAKRFEEIKAFVDKLTVEYFNDVVSLRLLSSVVDAGKLEEPPTSGATNPEATPDND